MEVNGRMTHSSWQNLWYIARNWLRWDKKGTILALLRIPVLILIPLITALIPKMLIETVVDQAPLSDMVTMLAGMWLVVALLNLLRPALDGKMDALQHNISLHYAVLSFEKLIHMDYANLESYEGRQKDEISKKFAFDSGPSDGAWALVRLIQFATSVLGISAYAILFGVIHPTLLLVILATCFLEFLISRRIMVFSSRTESRMSECEMGFAYFYRIATNAEAGKDIRLSGAQEWLQWRLAQIIAAYIRTMRWYTRGTTELTAFQALCGMARDMAIFGYLIYAVIGGQINIADFVFYFGLVAGFADWLNSIFGHVVSLSRISRLCGHYRSFLDLPDYAPNKKTPLTIAAVEKIEFRNVGFAYEKGAPVLKDVSFVVCGNENIAIVGENGAGKTTLIKLLCGLYRPTSGQILINDMDTAHFDREEYVTLFSAIFQEYAILPMSIMENITMSADADESRVWDILRSVGLYEKVKAHPLGLGTKLVEQVNAGAVGLSGGEKQRLLLARALYKDAPILVLDEPTAAMDPIAEERLYAQYRALTQHKVSFYISHRLTSTRFCDRILLMQDGGIKETGTHRQLLDQKGVYRDMYRIQSLYYQQEVCP